MKYFFTILFSLLSICSYSQNGITWSAPITVATSSSGNYHPRIALDRAGNPLVIWGTASNRENFARWTGSAFSTPVILNTSMSIFSATWGGPDIASFGDTVYITIKRSPENISTNYCYLIHSYDGGQSFSSPVRIDNINDSLSRFPIVCTDTIGNPIVAFMKFDSSYWHARYVVTKSADFGNTFSTDVRASALAGDSVCNCCPATLLSAGNTLVMLYRDNNANLRDMWAGISTNAGSSFSNDFSVDNTNWMINACPASGPDGVLIGDSLYTIFMSSATGSSLVYFSRSSVSGASISTCSPITGTFSGLTTQNYPRIASSGNAIAMAWVQTVNGTSQAALKFKNSLNSSFPAIYDTLASGNINNVDVFVAPGIVHVVWEDDNSGTVKYRKGTYTIAPTSVAKEISNEPAINIYPNPASEYFTISAKDIPGIATCTLIDNAGKRFDLKPIGSNNKTTISVRGLANGLYSVLLTDNSDKVYHSKLLIQSK